MVKIAMDLLHEGEIDEKERALKRCEPGKLDERSTGLRQGGFGRCQGADAWSAGFARVRLRSDRLLR